MEKIDLILLFVSILAVAGLVCLSFYAENVQSPKWRLAFAAPCIFMLPVVGLGGFEPCMLGVYVGCLALLTGFFCEKKKVRIAGCMTAALGMLLSIVLCLNLPVYRCPDYVKDFEKAIEEMRQNYCLKEYKQIDFDALYQEYLPKFREVNKTHDQVAGTIVWNEFSNEFYDGHVYFVPNDQTLIKKADQRAYGNDYGLSMMQLCDGRFVAVNVDKDIMTKNVDAQGNGEEPNIKADASPIHNGTQILLWDGEEPEKLCEQISYFGEMNMPDAENAAFYKPMYIAGLGGDEVSVCYLNDNGEKCETTLTKTGYYTNRLKETMKIVDQGRNIGHLDFEKLNDETILFRIKMMMYDSDTNMETDYSQMEREITYTLEQYKKEGVKNIVIDLRSNTGGSLHMVMAIAKLFDSEGEHAALYGGVMDQKTGQFQYDEKRKRYEVGEKFSYQGCSLWKEGKIVVLVNAQCISGGDEMAYLFAKMEHATVMGLTKSNGSGQGTLSVRLQSGMLSYSAIPSLKEDGSILIDSGADHKAQSFLNEKIAFDEEAVHAIFDEQRDYVLDRALAYLERTKE